MQRGVLGSEVLVVDRTGVHDRRVTEQVAQLVQHRHVVDRQRAAVSPWAVFVGAVNCGPSSCGPHDLLSSRTDSSSSTPSLTRASRSGSCSQPSTVAASSTGHHAAANCEERVVGADLLGELLLGALTAALAADLAPHRVDERGGDPGRGSVAQPHRQQLPPQRAELARTERDHVVAVEDAELAGCVGHGLSHRTAQHLGHRSRTLHLRDRGLVTSAGAYAVDDLTQRTQGDGCLAERGQHALDVTHEHARRPDHQHAAALVAPAVGVEQVRRTVQRDHGLPGAGTTGDRHDALVGRADRPVLLGLDGRDDCVHRAVARAGQLGQQRTFAHDGQRLRRGVLRVEQVVLDAEHVHALAAQDPAAYDALRVGQRGLVEHGRRRGAPVDQHHVVVLVAQADAGRCSAGSSSPGRPCRGVRRPAPRGRRRGSPSVGPPGTPSRHARRGRPRCRSGRGRGPPWPVPARTGQPCRAGV